MPNFALRIETVVTQQFDQMTYVIGRRDAPEVVVVDPGFDSDALASRIAETGVRVAAILLTHGHCDHIAGLDPLKAAHPSAPIVIGRVDAPMLTDADANLSAPYGLPFTTVPADQLVDEGDCVEFAGLSFAVREIPGHSPGSVVYRIVEAEPAVVIGGDVLFAGSVGRTDFPGGSFEQLRAGIRSKLFTLPDTTVVLPGHGPPTTVGAERRGNPFVGE